MFRSVLIAIKTFWTTNQYVYKKYFLKCCAMLVDDSDIQ